MKVGSIFFNQRDGKWESEGRVTETLGVIENRKLNMSLQYDTAANKAKATLSYMVDDWSRYQGTT